MKRFFCALIVLMLAAAVAPAARAAAPSGSALRFHDAGGLQVMSVKQFDSRDYNVAVRSPGLGRVANVRILVPAGYSPTRRYPVLYLFHGTSGAASDWVDLGNAEQTTARLPVIVVMPDAGFNADGGGWCTNWVDQATSLGPSQWETFHIDELIPWVDSNLGTVANRDGRAVAGLSQGGFCSTTYAARHPDLFASVASFSGAPDIDYNPVIAAGATSVIEATALGLDQVEPEAMFGSRATDEINWQGHDPTDLIDNLWPVSVWLWTGDGLPGPYDKPYPNPGGMLIEGAVHASTTGFYDRAMQIGMPVHLDDYVYGTHAWGYWARDLAAYMGPMMATFAHPAPAPRIVSYSSVDKSWTQWGWSVSFVRSAAQDWSSLTGAGAGGFSLSGSGTATVVTPPFYKPGSVERVNGHLVRADRSGRLHLTVPLGGSASPAVIGEPGLVNLGTKVTVTIGKS